MRRLFLSAAALTVIALASVQCKGGKEYHPLMGAVEEVVLSTCPEVSGLCLAPDGDGWIAASDENGVWRISRTGESTPLWTVSDWLDCEGVTVDPETKDIYYVVEGKQELCRLAAPEYKESETLFTLGDVAFGTNNGLEGITWYKDGIIFLGNQYDPILLVKYSLTEGELSRTELQGTSEIGDLCYDPQTGYLWIADSFKFFIHLCDTDGNVLQSYPMPFIANGEGICVDHKESCIWIGDDETSKLYKIHFDNL